VTDPSDIIAEYCLRTSTKTQTVYDASRFQLAVDIFVRHHEDLEVLPSISEFHDYEIMDMLTAVEAVLKQYKQSHPPLTTIPTSPLVVDTDVDMTDMTDVQGGLLVSEPTRPIRPHKLLMPPNRYAAKPYTKGTDAMPGMSGTPRKRATKKKKNKRKPKAVHAPCSRSDRVDPLAKKSEPTRQNKRNPMTMVHDKLSAKYSTIAMNCGTLSRRVRDGIDANYSHLSTDQRATLAHAITSTIREMVYIGTEVKRMILQATACYIAKTMTEYPTTGEEDTEKRKELFRQFDFMENNAFFANMMTELFCWHDTSKRRGRPKKDTAANRLIPEILENYRLLLDKAYKRVPDLKRRMKGGLGTFFQLIGLDVADTIQTHYRKQNLDLLSRVKQHSEDWYFGEGRPIVEDVDPEKGTSTKFGQVSLFWLLNSRLPPSKQLKYFPEAGFIDQHFVITERALLDALLAGRSKKDIVKVTFGGLLEDLANQPGDLTFKLFLSEKIDYAKSVSVVNPTLKEGTRNFGQRGILPLLGQTESEYESQVRMVTSASNYSEAKKEFKEYLDQHLDDPHEYQAKIDSGDREIACRKNILTGSISTNGHDIKVLARSITKPKPQPSPAKITNKTRFLLPDVKDVLNTTDQVQSQGLSSDAYVVVGIDPGVRSTATATIMTSSQPDTYWNMSISQGSQTVTTKRYLHALEGAKKKTRVLSNGQQVNLCELESRIQPVEFRQVEDTDPLPVWMSLRKSIEDHVTSIMRVDEPLREFYSSMLFKVKTWELQQAKTATSNKSIDRLLSTAESLGEEADAHRILVVVGDGAFTSHKGPTLHQHFITELKKKVGVSEYVKKVDGALDIDN
jgi:hypothetical protein